MCDGKIKKKMGRMIEIEKPFVGDTKLDAFILGKDWKTVIS